MKQLRILIAMLGLSLMVTAPNVGAAGIWGLCEDAKNSNQAVCSTKDDDAYSVVKNLINTFLFAVGALAVAMIVFSGFKFVNSRGNPESVKSARDTLLYSVIGLVVASTAFAIVNFVVEVFD